MAYVPLQVISSYSLLKSPIQIDDLVTTAKQRNYTALALTDINVMYGAVEFYNSCLKNGIKPLIGLTLELPGLVIQEKSFPVVLIAKNNAGYHNLMKVSSLKMTQKSFDWENIAKLLRDNFVIFPPEGEIKSLLLQGRSEDVSLIVQKFIEFHLNYSEIKFGLDFHQSSSLNDMLTKVAADNQVDVIALSPVHYLNSSDYFAKQVLNSIDQGTQIVDIAKQRSQIGNYWLAPRKEVEQQYTSLHLQAAVKNLDNLVNQTSVKINKQTPVLPKFKTPDNISAGEFLHQLCEKGLNQRLEENHVLTKQPYIERLQRELKVIHSMGFDDYFLIVWDVINFAHTHNIITGPGRGSAAGSLVAYVLYITDVDPIKYDLLFERFLNPERVQMPDIDLDIPDIKRDQVLEYVHQKYGHQRVAQIITFGTLAAKQSIRDVGRVFGLDTRQQDKWSKAIPNAFHITLKEAFENSQPLKNLVADGSLNQALFETARSLEGLPRHYSTHAAGLVLSDQPIAETVPVQNGNEGLLMTQYSKDYVESVGLLKMDFLGLRNLSILGNALSEITRVTGKHLEILRIPLNDKLTMQIFSKANTSGVFQFESAGIRSVLRRLSPAKFEDIALVNALYRPGPMENIDEVIQRKQNPSKISYPDDSLKQILQSTYGVIVYQEQVMLVASTLAGFSLGQADILRRAMSKKKLKVMEQLKTKFIQGAKKRGHSRETAENVYQLIEKFANYGFNKSHAYAYSKMAYELAYLKVHFPGEFHVALLNSAGSNPAKIKEYLLDAKDMGVKIVGPNLNESKAEFVYQNDRILFGFSSIKGLRIEMVNNILKSRMEKGAFKSFRDFLSRLDPRFRKPDLVDALIYSGALDVFSYNRAELIAATPEYISSIELSGGSMELFKALEPKIKHMDEMPLLDKLAKENEYLGAYLSGHPTERYQKVLKAYRPKRTDELTEGMTNVYVILYISHVKIIRTKTGKQMAFLDGNDQAGQLSITVFPQLFAKIQSWLKKDVVIFANGKVEKQNDLNLVANNLAPADNVVSKLKRSSLKSVEAKKWYLRIDSDHDTTNSMQRLKKLAAVQRGSFTVIVYETNTEKKIRLDKNLWLQSNEAVKEKLVEIFGKKNVVFK